MLLIVTNILKWRCGCKNETCTFFNLKAVTNKNNMIIVDIIYDFVKLIGNKVTSGFFASFIFKISYLLMCILQ